MSFPRLPVLTMPQASQTAFTWASFKNSNNSCGNIDLRRKRYCAIDSLLR